MLQNIRIVQFPRTQETPLVLANCLVQIQVLTNTHGVTYHWFINFLLSTLSSVRPSQTIWVIL